MVGGVGGDGRRGEGGVGWEGSLRRWWWCRRCGIATLGGSGSFDVAALQKQQSS